MEMKPESPQAFVEAAIALGSNLGDRHAFIAAGLRDIGAIDGVRVVAASRVIETPPFGPVPQGPYLNAACVIQTTRTPRELLEALHAIERRHGRDRESEVRWGPRTLDLDLLLFGEMVIDEPGLQVPHPRMRDRRFVLEPLAQIGGGLRIPREGVTVAESLARLQSAPSA